MYTATCLRDKAYMFLQLNGSYVLGFALSWNASGCVTPQQVGALGTAVRVFSARLIKRTRFIFILLHSTDTVCVPFDTETGPFRYALLDQFLG